jgi:hypothetical protein
MDAYEVIMPKIFASIFGLRKGDNINDIKDNREFFLERLLERRHPEIPGDFYDIGLMRMNGNNIYLLNANEAIEREGIFERKTISTVREKKKIYRMYNG